MTKNILNENMNYPYYLTDGEFDKFGNFFDLKKYSKILIITDDKVYRIYEEKLKEVFNFPNVYIYYFKNGEKSKNKETVFDIVDYLFKNEFNRNDLIISFGGGVVSDISGFISSIYMRGINEIKIPTTILSGVDATVGGKNGINTKYGKNLIGTFKDPIGVFSDIKIFESLDKEIFYEGMAEVIKMSLILDEDFFIDIEKKHGHYLRNDIYRYIKKSVELKARIVNEDRLDKGIRHILNFGHTLGHAIEKASGGEIRHGQAVALGMDMINTYGEYKGITTVGVKKRVSKVLEENNLRIEYPISDILKYINLDKKRKAENLDVIVLKDIGKFQIMEVRIEDFKNDIESIYR